jgi:hypothetical protein
MRKKDRKNGERTMKVALLNYCAFLQIRRENEREKTESKSKRGKNDENNNRKRFQFD